MACCPPPGIIASLTDRKRVVRSVAENMDAQLNVYNVRLMRQQKPQRFSFLRFDPNNDCNVHCVYCHNHRSKEIVETDDFRAVLAQNVVRVDNFQVGCIMEPTLDSRLSDLMLLVAGSRARPSGMFTLQTNGILLHRHDLEKMRAAGLSHLSVSIDSANPATHKLLRGGTSLSKVLSNLTSFAKIFPGCHIMFITTVTRANVDEMESLVTCGLEIGVRKFTLREMFYVPDSDVVDHDRMRGLLLEHGQFSRMRDQLLTRFGHRTVFEFADNATLEERSTTMAIDSFRRDAVARFFRPEQRRTS